jgi:hypothetical protein
VVSYDNKDGWHGHGGNLAICAGRLCAEHLSWFDYRGRVLAFEIVGRQSGRSEDLSCAL